MKTYKTLSSDNNILSISEGEEMNLDDIMRLQLDKNKLDIVLISHVREPRGYDNPIQLTCSRTEKFSTSEFYEIYKGIVDAGYFIKTVYYNELDFIEEFIKKPSKFNKSLIFNLARNGIHNDKKTLVPAFCDMVSLPYTTSSSFACSMARNKLFFSHYLNSFDIKTPKIWESKSELIFATHEISNIKVLKKPMSESASQGIDVNSILSSSEINTNMDFDIDYLYQEYIDGYECEVPVFKINDKIISLDPIEIKFSKNSILTYEDSFNDNYHFGFLKDKVGEDTIKLIKKNAMKVFEHLNLDIYGRVDFRVTKSGVPYLIDIATTPYITKHSSFCYAFENNDLDYSDIFDIIIKCTVLKNNKLLK
ncbi:hypothetical protein [Amedibacillus sp. YH-ame10]